MSPTTQAPAVRSAPPIEPLPLILDGMPFLYEDEEEVEHDMGDANQHTVAAGIVFYGITAHLTPASPYRAYANLNLYYRTDDRAAYVSSDVMIVAPFELPADDLTSYRIGETGPAPIMTVEILSPRTAQQRDLTDKRDAYALMGVREYLIVDVMGIADQGPLLLKRLREDRTWEDVVDPDGGVTSQLGFRIVLESDGQVRLVDAITGKRYARPNEAQAEADASPTGRGTGSCRSRRAPTGRGTHPRPGRRTGPLEEQGPQTQGTVTSHDEKTLHRNRRLPDERPRQRTGRRQSAPPGL